jgi:allantoin racemase
MSDSGVKALRSLLDIPVIGPARSSNLTALMLVNSFSVLTVWAPWIPMYWRGVRELGLQSHGASLRSVKRAPNLRNLLGGSEDALFPERYRAGLQWTTAQMSSASDLRRRTALTATFPTGSQCPSSTPAR